MHAFAVQRLPKQCNQALKWCSNCCNCFITFAQFSSLMCYHYWFSFCKGFCKLCKRLTLENMSHFLCISKFWLLTNEGHNQILKKCWKAEDIKSKKYNCPVICNNCCFYPTISCSILCFTQIIVSCRHTAPKVQ